MFGDHLVLYTTASTASSSIATWAACPGPEQVVCFFREILGLPLLDKEALSQRTRVFLFTIFDLSRRDDDCFTAICSLSEGALLLARAPSELILECAFATGTE